MRPPIDARRQKTNHNVDHQQDRHLPHIRLQPAPRNQERPHQPKDCPRGTHGHGPDVTEHIGRNAAAQRRQQIQR